MSSALASAVPALTVLAAPKSGEALKAGPIGLAVILVLCIACYFLFRSMSQHLRKVREDFSDPSVDRVTGRRTVHPEPADPRMLPAEEAARRRPAGGTGSRPPDPPER